MDHTESTRVRRMRATDLQVVLDWRNDESVRRHMFRPETIRLEDHTRWFERASVDPDRYLLIFERDGVAAGFVNLYRTGAGGIMEWGFYAAPQAPRGTGRALGRAALQFAFAQAEAHKVCGQVLAHNLRSIRFHQQQGFSPEGVLRDQHHDGHRYHDIHCFGLLKSEWQAVP